MDGLEVSIVLCKNRTLQAGQRLEIRLLRADPIHRILEFEVERWLSINTKQ